MVALAISFFFSLQDHAERFLYGVVGHQKRG